MVFLNVLKYSLLQHLAHLPSSIPNILQTTTAYEIHERASSLEYVDWYYHQHEEPEREVSAQAEIDAIIRRTTDNIPVELEHELASMSPQSLAKVVLMDWVDRLREEREAVKNLQMKTEEVSEKWFSSLWNRITVVIDEDTREYICVRIMICHCRCRNRRDVLQQLCTVS